METCLVCHGKEYLQHNDIKLAVKRATMPVGGFSVCNKASCRSAFKEWFTGRFTTQEKHCIICGATGGNRTSLVHTGLFGTFEHINFYVCEACIPEVVQVTQKGIADGLSVSGEKNEHPVQPVEPLPEPPKDYTVLGLHIKTGEEVTVKDEAREMGMYVLGVQGQGKSSFLESLVYQDIVKGYAVIVVDPHRDLLNNIIAELPQDALCRVRFIDIEDVEHPFGVNLFTCEDINNPLTAVKSLDRVMHVFDRLFTGSERILLDKYLRNLTYLMLANPGANFAHIPRLLTDEAVRLQMLQKVKQVHVRDFWLNEYAAMTETERRKETKSIMSRVNKIITNPMLERILTQPQTTIDFRRAIEQREILLINLPLREYGQTASDLGTVLLAEIYRAVFSFADTPRVDRPGFSLYVDEFQNFVTDDFAVLFKEGRKYGCKVAIAHQDRADLTGKNTTATLTANTFITFQPTNTDANEIAPLFIEQETDVALHAIHRDVHKYMPYHKDKRVRDFWDSWLRKMEEDKGDHKELADWLIKEIDRCIYRTEIGDGFDTSSLEAIHKQLARYYKMDDLLKARFTRQLMEVVQIVFDAPIGDIPTATRTDASQNLRALAKRHALVRIGGVVSSFATCDTPARVGKGEREKRKIHIQQATREKYAIADIREDTDKSVREITDEETEEKYTDAGGSAPPSDEDDEEWGYEQ